MTLQRGEQVSWLLRGALSYLYYDSLDATGITKVKSPGESIGMAVRYSGSILTATFGPGYETRQTKRTDPFGLETNNNERGAIYQGDIFFQAAPLTSVSLIGSYGQASQYFWLRGGVKQQISNHDQQSDTTLHAGAEVTSQGNKDINTSQIGGVFEIAYPRSRASLQLRAGYSRSAYAAGTQDSGAYFGVGSYWAY